MKTKVMEYVKTFLIITTIIGCMFIVSAANTRSSQKISKIHAQTLTGNAAIR
jgi:hypothetical protein